MTGLRLTGRQDDLTLRREKVTLILHEFDVAGSAGRRLLARGFVDRAWMSTWSCSARERGRNTAVELMGADIPILYLGRKWAPRH